MFAKLAIVVNVLVYIVDINIVVYVMCGVVCCVVPLYLQASVAESGNIRAVMPLLKVAVVNKKRRSLTPELAAQRLEAHRTADRERARERYRETTKMLRAAKPELFRNVSRLYDGATCLGNLDRHFKDIDGLSMSVDVQA